MVKPKKIAISLIVWFLFFLPLGFYSETTLYQNGLCYAKSQQSYSKWETVEIKLTSNKVFENPYTEVKISAIFRGPSNIEYNVDGFWDGGNNYKVRFTPTAEGRWEYAISSNTSDLALMKNGSINVSSGQKRKGFLRRDSKHRKSFVFDNGERFLMVGQTYYEILRKAMAKDDWKYTIKTNREYGFNKIRILLWVWNSAKNYYPKAYPFENNNLDKINPVYFQKFDEIIKYMNSLGIVADVILLREGKGRLDFSFDQTTRYIKYAVARYAAFTNVIWTLVNEWELSDFGIGKEGYWDLLGNLMKNEDPWHSDNGFLRPLSIHQVSWPFFKWGSSGWPVYANVQYGVWNGLGGKWNNYEDESLPRFSNGDEWGNYSIVSNLHLNMPVVNDEYGYFGQYFIHKDIPAKIDRENLRRAMWSIYVAGGYGSMGDDSTSVQWKDKIKHFINTFTGGKSKLPKIWLTGDWKYLPVYDDVKRMVHFWKSNDIPYWEMSSQNSLVSKGKRVYVLAKEPREYVAYSATGDSFELSLPLETFSYTWFDPKTGKSISGNIKVKKRSTPFSPPFPGDAVVYLVSAE